MSATLLTPPLWGLVFTVSGGVLLWLVSLRLRDASIAAIFWGPGIAGVVDIAAWLAPAAGPRASVALFLVNIWALRLAAHIFARRAMVPGGEDRRHAALRRQFGPRWWWWSLVQVFLLQAILIWFIPAPLVAAMLSGPPVLDWLDYAGITLATFGLLFEAVADFQLARFRGEPANRTQVLDRGLWAVSRHPNYFGEAVMWWGFFLIGYSAAGAVWLVLSPVLVTILLLQVSGVALMEDGIEARRPAYADYKRRVSPFIPLPRSK
jgi:steroid 5-alpha reductase family enzyme